MQIVHAAPSLLREGAAGKRKASSRLPRSQASRNLRFSRNALRYHCIRLDRQEATADATRQLYRYLLEATAGRLQLCGSGDGRGGEKPPLPPLPEPLPISFGSVALTSSEHLAPLRMLVLAAGAACGISEADRYDLVLAAGEAAMNALVHGGIGSARVCADDRTGTVQVWIEDEGPGIAFEHLPRAILEGGYSTIGTLGQGFLLILHTSHRIFLRTGSTGTTIVLEQTGNLPWLRRKR